MSDAPIWVPDPEAVRQSRLSAFMAFCEARTGLEFNGWKAFHAWSVAQFRQFWTLFLQWSDIAYNGDAARVCEGDTIETAVFFPDVRLNYTDNLLRGDEGPGLVSRDETGAIIRLSRKALRDRVRAVAAGLRRLGVGPGDRVVAIARNTAESVIACLAVTGIGAVWSSVGPDQGVASILSRFGQLDPVILMAHGAYPYQGVTHVVADKIHAVTEALPTVRACIALDGDGTGFDGLGREILTLDKLASEGDDGRAWPELPFNHPLFILFSSGTTGKPKCIVHGTGGTLLTHLKEHRLHCDLGSSDVLFYQTSSGWMMWQWQLSALATGAGLLAYDGSATHPTDDQLWRLVSEEGVTRFGTSPAYLQYCADAGISPRERVDLSALRAVLSTGSVLYERHYFWIRDHVGLVPVQSISGGTDILGCFVLGNPNLPVWAGESQCVGLGLDVRALRPEGAGPDEPGELVCGTPFPGRPVQFWADPDGRKFHEAYFSQNEGLWTHGDFIRLYDRGTARILGRSDGVMNIRGIRIGPAEIYQVLQAFPEVRACMAVEQADPRDPGGSRMVLLVVMREGTTLDRPLILRIKKEISIRLSHAHVPAVIAAVPDLPTTFSGKASEKAARDAVNGRPVVNLAALRNPESLDAIRALPELRGRT